MSPDVLARAYGRRTHDLPDPPPPPSMTSRHRQRATEMGTSTKMIDKTYGHLAHDSEDNIHAVLNAPRRRSGVDAASGPDA